MWEIIFAARPVHDVNIISFLLTLSSPVLFVVYLFKYHNTSKATALVTTIIGLVVLAFFVDLVPTLKAIQNNFHYYLHDFNVSLVFSVVIFVMAILGVIGAIKGFNKKGLIVPAMVLSMLLQVVSFIGHFFATGYGSMEFVYVNITIELVCLVGGISLYVALLMFGLRGGVSAFIPASNLKEKVVVEKMSPEQALKLLKDKLDLEMITEEEYKAQRAEIISKL